MTFYSVIFYDKYNCSILVSDSDPLCASLSSLRSTLVSPLCLLAWFCNVTQV